MVEFVRYFALDDEGSVTWIRAPLAVAKALTYDKRCPVKLVNREALNAEVLRLFRSGAKWPDYARLLRQHFVPRPA